MRPSTTEMAGKVRGPQSSKTEVRVPAKPVKEFERSLIIMWFIVKFVLYIYFGIQRRRFLSELLCFSWPQTLSARTQDRVGEGACAGAPSSHPVPSSILHPCDFLRQNERKSSRTDYLFVRGWRYFWTRELNRGGGGPQEEIVCTKSMLPAMMETHRSMMLSSELVTGELIDPH
ncbi:hypothetical protein CDAR_413791 [Caerostris darwini]|uniref:Uncharacterized protein n=1 Tax=Caerostris darwini TaxID=1538125 RepID=A0AAV4UE47_9ARAC|nr:hypothetical protein CDAR_413791 [Caerostris darwini]